jgi:hypothetical protein
MGATRDIGKGFVDRNSLHEWCEIIEDLEDGIACLLRGRKSLRASAKGVGAVLEVTIGALSRRMRPSPGLSQHA